MFGGTYISWHRRARSGLRTLALRLAFSVLAFGVLQGCHQQQQHRAVDPLASEERDFGVFYYSGWYGDPGFDAAKQTLEMELRNTTATPKRVTGIIGSCDCSDVQLTSTVIPPGGSSICQIRVGPLVRWGRRHATVSVHFDDGTVEDLAFTWAMYPRLTWLRPEDQRLVQLGRRVVHRVDFLSFGPSQDELYATVLTVDPPYPFVTVTLPPRAIEPGVLRQRVSIYLDFGTAAHVGPHSSTVYVKFAARALPAVTRRVGLVWYVQGHFTVTPSVVLLPATGDVQLLVTGSDATPFAITGYRFSPPAWNSSFQVDVTELERTKKRVTLRRTSEGPLPGGSRGLLVLQTDHREQPEIQVTLLDYTERRQ